MTESTYPYTAGDGTFDENPDCLYSASKATDVKILAFSIHENDADFNVGQMKGAIQSVPLMIAFAANNKYIHSYESGVIDARDCYTGDDDINPIN